MNSLGIFCSYNEKVIGGQTTKTMELISAASKYFNDVNILNQKLKKSYFHLFKSFTNLFRTNQNIIIIISSSGYFKLLPFVAIMLLIYNRNVYEITTGGFRYEYIRRKKWSIPIIKKFKRIYVESRYMVQKYQELGVMNVEYMPNYKEFQEISADQLDLNSNRICFKMCTFSRVDKYKGVDIAIEVCNLLHKKYNDPDIILDIYGPIDEAYKAEFENILNMQPKYISYKGVVDNHFSINTLKEYDCLLCPTTWENEGFPGAFIDALASGLPILATNMENFKDIVRNGENGFLISKNDVDQYIEYIMYWYENRDELLKAKQYALKESRKYQTDFVLKRMFQNIDDTNKDD